MQIVDAQIHLFGDDAEEQAKRISQIIMPADEVVAAMDATGVSRAYLVPVGTEGNQPCVDAMKKWPDRFRVMGIMLLNKPEARELVANWEKSSPYLGVRLSFPPFRRVSWLKDGTADWFWPEANRLRMPVMIWAPSQTDEIAKLAEKYPDIRFIIDHLNLFVEDKDDVMVKVIDGILPLARFPNVAAKATCLPCHTSDPYPFRGLHGPIQKVVEAYGADRVMWGTDLTRLVWGIDLARRNRAYQDAVTMFTEELKFLSKQELEKIMAGTALRWLGW